MQLVRPLEHRSCVVRTLFARLLAVMAAGSLLLGGCAQRPPAPDAPQETAPAPVPAPRPEIAPAPAEPPSSQASNLEGYKREVADRIYVTAAERIFPGTPPHLLRSVIVLRLTIDANGRLVDARVFRDNGDAETTRTALDSARQGSPYPKPPPRLLRGGRLEVSETWLFQEDGRFQLRTRAEAWQQ